ncbi:hypothetical protein KKC08_05670 [Patescibacteria group bacterium]|nr:hypothetical protein [Patescibacteria group bacterium]MCG2701523.1 hypothetical protein [Candidatus Parcubacteria bacterium]MBU4210455.1 hypothetical protein [Patescibacteria group bacterium]MBU4265274.1 hypothetical protein [Patescibacteria group bacterium]MBU4389959.1 hypothetical protein [Patescibacteria group bacterium]
MNKKILVLPLILSIFLVTKPVSCVIFAQDVSGTNESTTSEEIEKIRKSVQEKVQEKLKDIVEVKTTQKAWIGTISKIEDNDITIKNDDQEKTLTCTDDTVFIDLNRNQISIDKLKGDQIVLGMGYSQNDQPNVLDTKRLIISQNSLDEMRSHIILGKITDVSQSSPVFTITSIKDKNSQFQIKYDSKKVKQEELKTDQKIIVILKSDPKNNNDYTLIDYKVFLNLTPTLSEPKTTVTETPATD